MGHQEASPPRQRHRVPHHRRHHHRRNHTAAAQTTRCNPSWTLGRLNRDSHAPDSHATVESWLAQLAAPVPASRPGLPLSRNQLVHHGKRSRSEDSFGSSCRQRPRRADQLWRPQHIPSTQGSSPHRLPLLAKPKKHPKRYERNSDDSSLISGLSPRRELQESDCTKTTAEHEENSHYGPLDETEIGAIRALSPMSHIGAKVPAFEKRPRHKTRPDKYDTKKLKGNKRRGKAAANDEHQPRGSKSKKGNYAVNGENAMKNFTSEAVTNGRITVQPNLKPGLFNNKRVPKEHHIADLSFSEMPFPTHQEHSILQQKGLSSSRLRERQRESRELEQISSFFVPACADTMSRKSKPAKHKDNEAARDHKSGHRDNATSAFNRNSFTTPSSPHALTPSYRRRSSTSLENSCSIPTVTASGPNCRPSSSKTTYFTWSSSQTSHRARNYLIDTRPEPIESARSVTPEDIKEALAITGIYRNTGIRSYDHLNDPQNHALKVIGESPSTRSSIIGHKNTDEVRISAIEDKSKMKPRCINDTRIMMAQLTSLGERWNTILPPEWKLRRSSEDEVSQVEKQQVDTIVKIPTSVDSPSRQEIAREARVNPMRELLPAHHPSHHSDPDSDINVHRIAKIPVSVPVEPDRILDDVVPADEDQATITSRDAMPPPPVPPPQLKFLHSTNPEPGHGLGSLIGIETTTPFESQVQVSNCEQPGLMDSPKATGERCKLSGQSKRVTSAIDSVSWLPQAVTSGIASYDRDKTTSRLSMRSSIYENRGKEMDTDAALRLTSPPTAHMNETMADFIARIESEFDEPTCLDEYSQPESIIEGPKFSADQETSTYNMQNRHLPTPDRSQIHHRHLPSSIEESSEFKDVFETGKSFPSHESATSFRNRSSIMSTKDQSNNDIDEFLEMSKFWRPNRFAHF
ncbi:hypothetical protein F5Y12DRAFT_49838 [Xylaria sp. FL1777]|nr:hypothetical protein F5Y12DRAFT_49838 [Xylaria sp. FL1777]